MQTQTLGSSSRRKTRKSCALLLVAVFIAGPLPALAQAPSEPTTFRVREGDTAIQFTITKWSVFKEEGRFRNFNGSILYDPKHPEASRVEFEIRVASIDTKIDTRNRVLLSEDFFHADRYPTMSFRSTRVVSAGKDTFQVTGALTIRGVTQTITVPVKLLGFHTLTDADERVNIAGFETSFTLDRTAFGVNGTRWSGGQLILGSEVTVTLLVSVENRVESARRN
ncbi:MAG TPA: YceI family protein [Candidatus Acidoferrales bacterium]|nr:YceI family protein [Candidatus Acidoferrales bacterium]